MKRLMALLIATAPLTACATVSPEGLCAALRPLEAAHADTLQGPGVPDDVLVSGARLIAGVDHGCNR